MVVCANADDFTGELRPGLEPGPQSNFQSPIYKGDLPDRLLELLALRLFPEAYCQATTRCAHRRQLEMPIAGCDWVAWRCRLGSGLDSRNGVTGSSLAAIGLLGPVAGHVRAEFDDG